jgi:uncharacterized protein (DUF2141 family)
LSVKAVLIFILLASTTYSLYSQVPDYSTGKLVITFTGIRSSAGNVLMGLYNASDQWTDSPFREFAWSKEQLKNGSLTIEIDNLPRTTYACAVLDDENSSMTMNFTLGLPTEGWGMSNNPSFIRLKAPAFDEVSFELDSPVIRFEINMVYLNKNKKVR